MASISCQDLVELVTDYLEGLLDEPDRRRFEEHLAECDGCDLYVDQMRETLGLLGTVPEDSLPPAARSALIEAFRDFRR